MFTELLDSNSAAVYYLLRRFGIKLADTSRPAGGGSERTDPPPRPEHESKASGYRSKGLSDQKEP